MSAYYRIETRNEQIMAMCQPVHLVTAAQSRALDRMAIEGEGIPGSTLMLRAGKASFDALMQHWGNCQAVLVFCGSGNNGGDGYVIARLAYQHGLIVDVICLSDPVNLKGDAANAYLKYSESGAPEPRPLSCVNPDQLTSRQYAESTVIVDALLGTGIDREVLGDYGLAIDMINRSGLPTLAVDIPSGLNADTGRVMGCVVRADITCTFIAPKIGLYTGDAADCCGQVLFDDLDVPDTLLPSLGPVTRLTHCHDLRKAMPARPGNSHKGMYGAVAVVGGSSGMTGAAILAARAAMRSGCGMTRISVLPGVDAAAYASFPEAMTAFVNEKQDIENLLEWSSVIAVGPGLGLSELSCQLLKSVLASDRPRVIDADALTLLAQIRQSARHAVLTPHPGEAARLLDCGSAEVQQNRLESAVEIAQRYDAVCVLKGSGTVVADAGGARTICANGSPAMATAGMGDVLTGIVAALLAQGLVPLDAASLGAQLHASAGDLAADGRQRGLLATDVIEVLPECLSE